ncbi:hypothetical protein M6B38_236750 [Iris pallida]|uniref:Uncharacterized protein n=1 Tax=Iris pallida TaxID=29817 RepID=A0AAX6DNV0_IRIPA|nr:hypothetical protein M6B38_236750 [Iris pallida]
MEDQNGDQEGIQVDRIENSPSVVMGTSILGEEAPASGGEQSGSARL